LNRSIERVRTAAKGDNAQAIKSALSDLEQAAQAVSKVLYAQAQPCGAAAGGSSGSSSSDYRSSAEADDEAIDAEFEVKK
jgi:molecular chaperone DnaK